MMFALWGCAKPDKTELRQVRPGDSVFVTVEEFELVRGMNLTVSVGGRQSHYVNIIDRHPMEIRVPLLPSGEAQVEVRSHGETVAGPRLSVTALDHQKVSLFVEGDSLVILAIDPTDDPLPSSPAPDNIARISYCLLYTSDAADE